MIWPSILNVVRADPLLKVSRTFSALRPYAMPGEPWMLTRNVGSMGTLDSVAATVFGSWNLTTTGFVGSWPIVSASKNAVIMVHSLPLAEQQNTGHCERY